MPRVTPCGGLISRRAMNKGRLSTSEKVGSTTAPQCAGGARRDAWKSAQLSSVCVDDFMGTPSGRFSSNELCPEGSCRSEEASVSAGTKCTVAQGGFYPLAPPHTPSGWDSDAVGPRSQAHALRKLTGRVADGHATDVDVDGLQCLVLGFSSGEAIPVRVQFSSVSGEPQPNRPSVRPFATSGR